MDHGPGGQIADTFPATGCTCNTPSCCLSLEHGLVLHYVGVTLVVTSISEWLREPPRLIHDFATPAFHASLEA